MITWPAVGARYGATACEGGARKLQGEEKFGVVENRPVELDDSQYFRQDIHSYLLRREDSRQIASDAGTSETHTNCARAREPDSGISIQPLPGA